jgi:hypothetical protein
VPWHHRFIPPLNSQSEPAVAVFCSLNHVHLSVVNNGGAAQVFSRPLTPEEALDIATALQALACEVRNPDRIVRHCASCGTDTPHGGSDCLVCGMPCCLPDDGELCPHCLDQARLAADNRRETAVNEHNLEEIKP